MHYYLICGYTMYSVCVLCLLQLVEMENVRAVISYNEEYELNYFTNSKKVSPGYLTQYYLYLP